MIVRKTTTLRWGACFGTLLALSLAVTALHRASADPAEVKPVKEQVNSKAKALAAAPKAFDLGFVENKGQWNEAALFYGGWRGLDVWVTETGIKYDFYKLSDLKFFAGHKGVKEPRKRSGHVIDLQFVGANPKPVTSGVGEREGVLNFIRSENNVAGVHAFNEAWVTGLYPGVNMRVYRDNQSPRFDLVVAPGVNPNQIKFRYNGATSARVGDKNTLYVTTRYGEVSVTDLYAYQQVNGQNQQVQCKFVQNPDGTFGFQVSGNDGSKPLIIDPVVYSTLFGGYASGLIPGDDLAYDAVVDQFNQAFVCGSTVAINFPITNGAYDNTVQGFDAFVAKFRHDATNLIWSTVIGGDGAEEALAIALDRAGRACITGYTTSPDQPATGAFPTTPNAFQTTYRQGGSDGFIARLNNTGSALDYGTYAGAFAPPFPPPPGDFGFDIGVDRDDNMYIVGQTEGPDFPTTAGTLQPNYGGSTTDGFAVRVSSAGIVDYSTFVGGNAGDSVNGIAVDDIGNSFLVGSTGSVNFPLVAGSFDTAVQGSDAFVSKLVPSGTSFDYSTVIGGSAGESGNAIDLDNNGNAYIIGSSGSVDFPRTAGCFDDLYDPPGENFTTKLAIDGRSLVYSTFMGGGGSQQAIGVDDLGVAHIAGINNPFAQPIIVTTATGDDQTYNGPNNPFAIGDAYLQALDEAGSNMLYGSFFGGPNDEAGLGLYVDGSRNAYLVGVSNSDGGGFPTTPGVFKETMFNDNFPNPPFWDAFLMKIKVRPSPLLNTVTITPGSVAGTEEAQMNITLTAPASPGGAVIRIQSNNENIARTVDAGGNLLDQVVIPEGSNSAGPLRITTADVVSQFVVTFTVELEGDTKTANITVAPWLTNLIISPNSVVGGNRVTGRVTLFRPSIAGMTVSVSTSDPTLAYAVDSAGTRINSFVVPTGDTTATFDILTRGVDAATNVTVLAKITTPNLQVTRSQTLRIVPASLRSVTFSPNRVNGGEKSTGTVLMDGEAGPTPIRVDLRQGTTGNPPVNVTFPNGLQTFAVWIIRDVNDVEKGKSKTFQVTAGVATNNTFRNVVAERLNTNPVQTRQGTLFVDQTGIASLDLESLNVVGGQWVKGHITLTQPAAPSGLRCKVRSNNGTYAPFGGTVTEIEVFVPAGAIRSNDFTITTKLHKGPGNVNVQISTFKQDYPTLTQTLVLRPIDLTFTATPAAAIGGSQNFDCNLLLTELAPTNGVTTAISSSDTVVTVPSTVKIDEGTNSKAFTAVTKSVVAPRTVTLTATINTLPSALVKTVSVTVNPLSIGLTISPNPITGGLATTGTVTVGAPAGSSGLRVTLGSSNTAVAVVPSAIVIPTGQTQGTFNIATFQVGANTNVTISARTPAGVQATATLTVVALNIQVTVNPNSVVGGIENGLGNIAISAPAPGGGTVVNLTSSMPSAAAVPASTTIPAGQTSRNFVITTSQVNVDRSVSITARLATGRSATTTMTVKALTIALNLNPNNVDGGPGFSTGLITLGSPAPSGGMNVTLSTNNAAANLPGSVVVDQGRTTKTFAITTDAVAVDTNATITARLPAGRTASAILIIRAARITLLSVDSFSLIGGDSTMGTVAVNIPAPAGGANIVMTSGNNAVLQAPSPVIIAAGNRVARFQVTTTVIPVDTNVTLTATYGSSTQTISIQVLAPTLVGLVVVPSTVIGGASTTGRVDIDRPAPAGGLVIDLSKDPNATGSPYVNFPATVTIPAGQRSKNFTITTSAVSRTVATQITASFGQRAQTASAVLTLNPQ